MSETVTLSMRRVQKHHAVRGHRKEDSGLPLLKRLSIDLSWVGNEHEKAPDPFGGSGAFLNVSK